MIFGTYKLHKATSGVMHFILMNSLRSRTASRDTLRETIAYLRREIDACIEPNMCPPNSQDLNRVTYTIWEPIYHGRKFDAVHQSKQAIVME